MPRVDRRVFVLAGLFLALAALSLYLLRAVLATVFFAITVAYVLYPLRRWLASAAAIGQVLDGDTEGPGDGHSAVAE